MRNSSDNCSFRIHVKLAYIQWYTPVSDWKQSRDPLEADCKVTVFTHDATDSVCLNRFSVDQLWFSLGVSQYDPRFGDAFWNSSKYNMVSYLLRMMTSWAIVVNVWYLPPMTIQVQLNTVLTWTYHCDAVTHWPKEQLLAITTYLSCMCVNYEQEGEDAAQFANRVKSAIAHQGGLLDLAWWGSSSEECICDTDPAM